MSHKIFQMPFATVYPLYVKKVARKGQNEADLRKVIRWLTGFTDAQLQKQIDSGATFEQFFAKAKLHPNASLITGVICGVKVQEITDDLMRNIRYMDKLVDELANGKAMENILRS